MIVSQNEGFAVSIGKGYHILMEDFLKYYDPEFYDESNPYLFYKKDSSYTKTQDIFLFQEKKLHSPKKKQCF